MDDKELKDVLYNRLQANGVDVSRNPITGTAASIKTGAVEGTKQAVNNAASFIKTDLTNTKYAKLNQAKKAAESNVDYDSFMDKMADKYGFKVRILKQSIMDDADKEMYFSAAAAKDLGINNIDDWNKINNEYNTKLSNIESERSAKQQESLTKQQATDRKYMLGTVGEFAQDLGSAAGNMAPSLGLGLINPALGLASFGTQAAAQSYGQALDEGATHEQATRYGVTTGLKEAAIERLTGGLSRFYGKGILDNVIGVQPNNTLRNVILNTAKGAAGEGAEEAISGAIDPFLQRATYNPEAENATLGELGYQAAIGAALGSLLGGGSNVVDYGISRNTARTQQNAAQQAQTQERTNTTTAENDQLKGVVEQPTMGENQGVGNVSENIASYDPNLHIDNRNYSSVGNRKVNAFQYDNPNVKPYIQAGAQAILNDLSNSQKPTRGLIRNAPGENGEYVAYGTKRVTSPEIASLLDEAKMTYAQIEKGAKDLIADEGKENNANAKKVELAIDQMLSYGSTDATGEYAIRPNADYIQEKTKINGAMAQDQGYNKNLQSWLSGDMDYINENPRGFARNMYDVAERLNHKITEEEAAEIEQLQSIIDQDTYNHREDFQYEFSDEDINRLIQEHMQAWGYGQQQADVQKETVAETAPESQIQKVKNEQIPLEFRRFVDKATSGNVGLKKEYAILPDNVNGYIKDNTIYINANKTNDILNAKRIVAHEIYHTFENTQEGQDIYRLALENSGINETDLLQAKKDAYAGVTALDDAGARAEVAADFIEKAMTDEATINRILTTKPNFAQRILQAIKNFISAYKAKRNMTDAEKAEYDRLVNAQKLYEQGFRKLQSGEYQAGVQNVRYSLSDMINQYGAKKQGASPRRDVEYPEATSEFNKTRSFARTVYETEGLNEKVYQGIEENLESDIQNGRFTYEPTSNERNINAANRNISKKGYEDAYTTIKSKFNNDDRFTAEDIATGEMLLKQASEKGDVDKAIDLVGMLSVIGTEYGQTIQAMSLLKRMTPEGRLKQLEGMRKRLESKYPQADIKPLNRKDVEVLLNQKSDVGIDEQAAYMMAKMAEDIPARAWDKVNALRYLAMLGNPRTHIRNTVGNALHFGMLGMKNQVAAAIEKVALPEGERSRSFGIANKELRDFAKQNYQESGQYLLGNKSKYDTNQADGRQIFKTKVLETARKTNENLMEFEDNVAKQMGYQLAFANYMKANNYTPEMVQSNKSLREKIEAHAADNARRVTFQEASALADALSRFENRKAKSRTEKAAQVAVGAVVPFKRTPINILKEGARFSPAGLIKGLSTDLYDMKQGKISANQVIDDIATGLTGTSILAIGYFLAEMGLLTIGYDSEEARKQNYQSQLGVQNYAFVLPGGGTYTIDWTAPAAMPLLAGAELANGEDGEVGLQRVLNALYNLTNPVLEMSMMQGIQDALQSYSSGAEGIAGSIQSGISGYAGQFVPTLLGQIARTIDETKRSTYAPKDSPITQSGEKLLRTTANKLPGVSMTSEASIDVWGRERQQEGENVITRALNQMLSPGTYASNKSTFVDDEINRLYNAIGESGVIPKSAEKYVRYGDKTYQLSAKDYTAFQKTMGQGNYKDLEKLVKTDVYSSMDDVEKANAIEKIYDYNRYKATSEYLSKKGVTYTNSSYDSMKEKLNTVGGWKNYFELEQAFPDTNFDTALKYKEKCDQYNIDYTTYGNAKTAINDLRTANSDRYTDSGEKTEANRRDTAKYLSGISSLTDPQRQAIWSEIYTGKTSETYKSVANRYGY